MQNTNTDLMKKPLLLSTAFLMALFLSCTGLRAQEKQEKKENTKVTVRIEKDGNVIQDTTFLFEDAEEAMHAVEMMEMLSGEEDGMMEHSYSYAMSDDDDSHTLVVVSRKGKNTEIREMTGDSLVWVSEDGGDDGQVKVISKKLKDANEDEENVYVISGDDDVKAQVEKILKDHGDADQVKVVVIEKKDKSKDKEKNLKKQ